MGKGTIKTKAMTMAVAMSMVAGLCPSTVFAANSEDVSKVQDGTYTGTAKCTPNEDQDFDEYDLSVDVTIENGVIQSIGNISGNGAEDKRPHARPSRSDYESSQNRRYGTGAVDYGYADTVSRLKITTV